MRSKSCEGGHANLVRHSASEEPASPTWAHRPRLDVVRIGPHQVCGIVSDISSRRLPWVVCSDTCRRMPPRGGFPGRER